MIWEQLKHFTKSEAWGEPDKMNPRLLLELDAFREYLNAPIFISCGTQGRHENGSQHYIGNAVDIVLMSQKFALLDVYLMAERFKFNGIGVYPFWKYNGQAYGGLHLDVGERVGRWIGYPAHGEQKYMAINKVNLKQVGLT